MPRDHEYFMPIALEEAARGKAEGNIAVGSIIVQDKTVNWLRVLGTAELAQIDQRVCQHLHAIMPLLDTFKSEQQSLELIFPRKGALDTHPQGMDGGIKQPLRARARHREM